jgi:squalene-hopene/tetraprenyl-beta-curcumene cyclase
VERDRILKWLLEQQYKSLHPYTNSPRGGWAWTDLPGGVPDADDTIGALLALSYLSSAADGSTSEAVRYGFRWLSGLQNSDGGIPTFCRGWTNLPFDRSSPDITAHLLRACHAWDGELPELRRLKARAMDYLLRCQGPGGEWIPLWFGNQFDPRDENHIYGTAKVVLALASQEGETDADMSTALCRGALRLSELQNKDGSWGAQRSPGSPSAEMCGTIEETALAVEALAHACFHPAFRASSNSPQANGSLKKGLGWLLSRVDGGTWKEPAPIGFYFAKLWYYERLYPIIFTVGAFRAVLDFYRETCHHKIN